MRKFTLLTILAFVFLATSREIAFGEPGIAWESRGVQVCTATGNQQTLKMVSDRSGGAIIVWEDWRGVDLDIYAQRISGDGNLLWGEYGVAVCTATLGQKNPVIVGDGYGGAIIAWEDYRNVVPNIYASRITSTGAVTWQIDGLPLAASMTQNQLFPDIVPDGLGGAVIVWQENESGIWRICGQRVGYNGVLPWVGSTVLSQGTKPKEFPKIINDGTGYVIITWQDYGSANYDIYAQRVLISSGTVEWESFGMPVSTAFGDQLDPEIVPDGLGGAIITWTDYRNSNSDIYAQWIMSTGVRVWGEVIIGDPNGIPVCQMERDQSNPVVVSHVYGGITVGAIIAWEDRRVDPNGDIYAEKVPLYVGPDWTGGGKAMAIGKQIQICPRLVTDNQGGGIITWIENDLISSPYKIFASKRNQNGDPVWSMYPGVLVCQASNIVDHQIVSDGSLGVIIAWQSGPSTDYNIYAQRVTEDGTMPTSASISGRVTLPDGETGITGVEVEAWKDGELKSSVITDIYGKYGLTGLVAYSTYTVRAMWTVNGIESSVSMEAVAPSYRFDFTLEIDYFLGTIAGNVSGVEREAKRVSGAGFKNSLSPGNSIAFVELEQRGKVIVRVPVEADGNYNIPNLLPGRFIARAYNGTIYSKPRMVNLKEGETLRVDFAFGIMPEETVYNYPNPAKSGSTTIRYYCGYTDPEAEIKIYNIAGELVKKVRDSEIDKTDAHIYKFLWDLKNNSGKSVTSGIYLYIVEVKEKSNNETKRVIKKMAVVR